MGNSNRKSATKVHGKTSRHCTIGEWLGFLIDRNLTIFKGLVFAGSLGGIGRGLSGKKLVSLLAKE